VQPAANPNTTGSNSSAFVASYLRSATEEFDVIYTTGQGYLTNVLPYVFGFQKMRMQVLSPVVGTVVQITLQSQSSSLAAYPTGRHSEYRATTTVANAWENLEFSFQGRPDATISPDSLNEFVIQFAPGVRQAAQFYFDNLIGPRPVSFVAAKQRQSAGYDSKAVPNPVGASGRLQIEVPRATLASVVLTNQIGQTIKLSTEKFAGAGRYSVALPSNLTSGIYTYQIVCSDATFFGRFVK
jgi:hypothetical protein